MYTELIMDFICTIGVIAFAISGAMAALDKHTDPFGTVILAVVTATGGGIFRDILLGLQPPKVFIDPTYVLVAAATALIIFLLVSIIGKDSYLKNSGLIDSINNIFDALGLGVFVVMGTQSAIEYGFSQNAFFCIFLGTITGIGGGFIRDIMAQEIPVILRKHVYALAAIAGSGLFFIMHTKGMSYTLSAFASAGVTFTLRMLATRYKWNLPPAF